MIDVELEDYDGSAVVRDRRPGYARQPASAFLDKAAGLTERQAVFYRNLIRLALARNSSSIPVDFELARRGPVYLDRGCVKIAELAGFLEPLSNGPSGVVDNITLAWRVRPDA